MSKAKAAEMWDQLERQLVRIGLPEDGRLLRLRPKLVRTIGDAIGERRRGGQRARGVTPPDKARLGLDMAAKPGKTTDKLPLPFPIVESMPARQARRGVIDDSIVTQTLARMLERSCGYSGDDEVTYGR